MDIISTLRSTRNITTEKLIVDMSNDIAQLQPNAAPLTVLLMKLRKQACSQPKFEWLEDDLQQRWDKVNMAGNAAADEEHIVVDNGAYFQAGDLVKVPRTGEVLRVVSVATNTLTTTRAYGETTAAVINDNDDIVVIGNANMEGADTPALQSAKEVPQYNFTQIYRTAFGATETEKASNLVGGNDLAYQRAKKGKEHRIDIERSFLFGERKEDTSTLTYPLRTTRGLLKWVSTNVTDIGGTISKAEWNDFLRTAFQYGSDNKIMLASGMILSVLSTWAGQQLQMKSSEKTYGIAINEYITPFGVLNLVYHRGLEGPYSGYGVVIDLPNLKYRYLNGRDTRLKTNVQGNGEDSEKDEYITEAGLEVRQEKTFAVIKGVTGAE